MLICPLCPKTFNYPSKLDHHMVSHTKEKPHKCPICPEAFGQQYRVKRHIKVVHDGIKQTRNKNHQCTMCSFKCYSKSILQIHVRKHSADLPFSCNLPGCGYRTKYKYALSKHALQAHSNRRPFKCPSEGCSYKAKTRQATREHLKIHSNDTPFECTVCDYRTKYNSNLRKHELTHTMIKRFQCQAPNCGYASYQSSNLKVHIDRKHRTNEVICTEPRCNFRCGSIALLKVHLKTHKLPILKCPGHSCGFRTKYNDSLLRHISSRHDDSQPSFTVPGTSVSDSETAGKMNTIQCNYNDCRFETKFRQHYDRHVATHEKEETGQHVCSFCLSRFGQSSLLRAHVQRHIREKPYSCSHCYYTTGGSSQLKMHARKIHQIYVIPRGKDDQVRKCRTCGRNCFSYGESVLHSMSHLQPVVVLEQLKLHVL